jgi:Ca2+-binding EF-hand superfamily protein
MPKASDSGWRNALGTLTNVDKFIAQISPNQTSLAFFNELLRLLIFEGKPTLLSFLNSLEKSDLLGIESQNRLSILIKKIEDCDHGKINYSEFLFAAMDFKKNVDRDKLIAAFSYFDIDKTGQIGINDIEEALLRSGKKVIDKEDIRQLIVSATKGKEVSTINLDEFLDIFGYKI